MGLFRKGASGARPGSAGGQAGSFGGVLDVVGESHYTDAIAELLGRSQTREVVAQLHPDPANQYDPDAIAVWVEGQHVGYLSRSTPAAARNQIMATVQQAGTCTVPALLILSGKESRKQGAGQIVLEPALLPPWSRPNIIRTLTAAGIKYRDGKSDDGFIVREDPSETCVFWRAGSNESHNEVQVRILKALQRAGLSTVVAADGYDPYVTVKHGR